MSRAARQMLRSRRPAVDGGTPQAMPLRRERVLAALEAMPEEDRLLLALDLCEGLSADETAHLLEQSPRAVRGVRDRLLTELRRAVGGAAVDETSRLRRAV